MVIHTSLSLAPHSSYRGCELRTVNAAGDGGRYIVVAQTTHTLTIAPSTWRRRLYWSVRRWLAKPQAATLTPEVEAAYRVFVDEFMSDASKSKPAITHSFARAGDPEPRPMTSDIPPSWFVEPLNALVEACYMHAPVCPGLMSLIVDPQLGLRLGIAPNRWMDLYTSCGIVRVTSRVGA